MHFLKPSSNVAKYGTALLAIAFFVGGMSLRADIVFFADGDQTIPHFEAISPDDNRNPNTNTDVLNEPMMPFFLIAPSSAINRFTPINAGNGMISDPVTVLLNSDSQSSGWADDPAPALNNGPAAPHIQGDPPPALNSSNNNSLGSVLGQVFNVPDSAVQGDPAPPDPNPTPEPRNAALVVLGVTWAGLAGFKMIRARRDSKVS